MDCKAFRGIVRRAARCHSFLRVTLVDSLRDSLFQVYIAKVIAHEADQPDLIFGLLDAAGLSGEDLTAIDLPAFVPIGRASADCVGFVVDRVVDVWRALRLFRVGLV